MAKILNLDELAPVGKELTYGGKTYQLKPLSMREFINITQKTEVIEKKAKSGNLTVSEQMEFQLSVISSAIPEMSKETLDSLEMRHIEAIMNYVKDSAEDMAEEGGAEGKE